MSETQKQSFKPGEKLLFMVAGAFIVFALLAFTVMQVISARSDKPLFVNRTHANFTPEGEKGSALFRTSGCTTCHRALREGTNMGQTADLDGEGSRRKLEWIYTFLQEPEKTYGAYTIDHGEYPKVAYYVATMPKENLHAIATFLSELKADQGSAEAPVPPKGDSPFIDSMVKTWAPESWKEKYKDVRTEEKGSTTTTTGGQGK
ncbi:MAG TPA: c-type cytochrome [Mariprofundaceae bacterium]|nr:c-type cytochrome [Mariprofundaceae bacterium]